jgi:sulfur-carrier protein
MAVKVRLHGAFREFAGGAGGASVEARSVGEALSLVIDEYPALRERLRDEHGRLRRHVSVFANNEEMRHLDGERTALEPGDVVHIIPAVSGG